MYHFVISLILNRMRDSVLLEVIESSAATVASLFSTLKAVMVD